MLVEGRLPPFLVRSYGRIAYVLSGISLLQIALRFRVLRKSPGLIEAWAFGHLLLSAAALWLSTTHPQSGWTPAALLYGVVRVVQLVAYQSTVVFFDGFRTPRSTPEYAVTGYRRLILLTLHNYLEIAFWFAAIYSHYSSFFRDETHALSSFTGALYYSAVTMTTVGYGDVVPICRLSRITVTLQLLVGAFLTLIILARFIAFLPKPRTLDSEERSEPLA